MNEKSRIASVTPSSFTQSDSVADCAAFKVVRGFNGADDREFIAELKSDIGNPSTVAKLPASVDGRDYVDARAFNPCRASHRAKNNQLHSSSTDGQKAPTFPLRPYKNAFSII